MFWGNRYRTTTTDTGTTTKTLSATPVRAHKAFTGLTETVCYTVAHQQLNEYEVGIGTVTGNVLTPTKVISSSNADAAVDFSAGTKDVLLAAPAELAAGSFRYKMPCKWATTANVSTLASGASMDGGTLAVGDRVLAWNQTNPVQNGIYVVVAGGALTRAVDMWAGDNAAGVVVFVTSGTANGGILFTCTAVAGSDIVGTSSISFQKSSLLVPVTVANGGTGATTAAGARTNLGVTATGADTTYAYRANNLSDLASASTARTNLGVTATGADTTYAYRANNLSDLADASTARTNLGLGTIATQASSSVTITGGSITGITDLAVADGGTGASTAANARTNLGAAASGAITASGLTIGTDKLAGRDTAGTGALEEIAIGSNLTLSAGILSTSSNVSASLTSTDNGIVLWSGTSGQILKQASGSGIIKATSGVYGTATAGTDYYAPGSTDVAVADGGTGASTAGAAATNLGLGTGDNVTHLTVTGAEASTGSGNGGLIATTATAGGNAGIRLASGGTDRFQFGCLGSAGSTSCRFYVYEDSAEGMRLNRNRCLVLGSTVTPTAGASCFVLGVAGTVLTPHSSQCGLYGETISSTTELRAVDGAGNRVTLTPHPIEVMESHAERMETAKLEPLAGTWGYRASNDFTGIETVADIGAVVRAVEWLMQQAGRPIKLVWETKNGEPIQWEQRQADTESHYQNEAAWHDKQLRRYVAQPFWARDVVVSRPILGSDKPEKSERPKWLSEVLNKLGA